MRAAKEAKGLTKQVCKTKLHVCNNFSPFVFYTTLALSIVQKLKNILQVCRVLFSIRPCLCVLSLSFVYKCVTRYPCVTALQVLSTPGGSLGSGIGPHKDSTFSEHLTVFNQSFTTCQSLELVLIHPPGIMQL